MKKLIFVSLATLLAVALFLAGPVSAQDDIIEKMLEPIPDETIKALLTKYPNDAQVHLGAAYLFTEDKNKAEAREKAINLAPGYKKIFLTQDLKGVYYKRFAEEDLKRLEELVKIDPGNAWPHYLLAGYYLKKGEKEKWLREMDEALSKERFDAYEVERFQAIFRVIDDVDPRFKAINKLHHWSSIALHELGAARASARELVRIGKEFEEKGEKERALEYYRKAERIARQLLLKKPEFLITRLTSVVIRKITYPEMITFYEKEGRVIEAAVLGEQLELMDGWNQEGKRTWLRSSAILNPLSFFTEGVPHIDRFDLEEIQPEKREEIKAIVDRLKKNAEKNAREFINSPGYTKMVDIYLEKLWTEGEIEALKALPDPEKSGIARYVKRIEKEKEELYKAIDRSLLPNIGHRRICKSNLKQIGLACILYAKDHNGIFPLNLETLIEDKYSYVSRLVKCPAQEEDVGYIYIGQGKSQKAVDNPSRTIIAYDKNPVHQNGRNVLFMDGHCEWMPEEEFQKRLAEQKEK